MKPNVETITEKGNVVFREGDHLIKCYAARFDRAHVYTEAMIASRAAEAGVSVPEVLGVRQFRGKWAMESQYIDGLLLSDLMAAHPEKEDEYQEILVDVQIAVSQASIRNLEPIGEKFSRRILQTQLPATVKYGLYYELKEFRPMTNLCHGDLTAENIILTDDGQYYVINWAHAASGDPLSDAAYTYLVMKYYGQDAWADKYLATYCRKTGHSEDEIRRWIPVVAAADLVIAPQEMYDFLMTQI